MRLSSAWLAVMLLVGCPGARTREPSTTPASVEPEDAEATLEYELSGHAMPMPFVRASIGTHETIFLVDTGSNSNVIASWFAEECGLPITSAARTVSGQTPMMLVDHPLISVRGFGDIDIPSALVVQMPAIFEELEIGGTLSPQLLTTDSEAVVLNLQRDILARVPRAHALDLDGVPGEFMTRTPVGVCDEVERGLGFRAVLVRANVGSTSAQLMISSGAATTSLETSVMSAPEARDVSVGFVTRHLDVGSVDGEQRGRCTWDGLLGRDFLANCVLVFDGDRMAGRCAE